MPSSPRPDLYISADIETDGPIPGEFSMLSFALSLASRFDGHEFKTFGDEPPVFYCELKPISDRFEQEALDVNGLDRELLKETGTDPAQAMSDAAAWIEERSEGARPVLVAYPVAFDWAFLYWYFIRFAERSPFGFSSCLDIRTLYQARTLTVHDLTSKSHMPAWLLPDRPHTHHAADDAREQGELFNNLFIWAAQGGGLPESDPQPAAPTWLDPLLPSGARRQRLPSPTWAHRLMGSSRTDNGG